MTNEHEVGEFRQEQKRQLKARLLCEFQSHHFRKRRNRRFLAGGTVAVTLVFCIGLFSFFGNDTPQIAGGQHGRETRLKESQQRKTTGELEYIDDEEALRLLAEVGAEGTFAEINGTHTLLLVSDLPSKSSR